MGLGTKAKFRHYRLDPESGVPMLIWAQDGELGSVEFDLGEVPRGSDGDLEVIRSQLWTPHRRGREVHPRRLPRRRRRHHDDLFPARQ